MRERETVCVSVCVVCARARAFSLLPGPQLQDLVFSSLSVCLSGRLGDCTSVSLEWGGLRLQGAAFLRPLPSPGRRRKFFKGSSGIMLPECPGVPTSAAALWDGGDSCQSQRRQCGSGIYLCACVPGARSKPSWEGKSETQRTATVYQLPQSTVTGGLRAEVRAQEWGVCVCVFFVREDPV